MKNVKSSTWAMVIAGVIILSSLMSAMANYLTIRQYYKTHKSS